VEGSLLLREMILSILAVIIGVAPAFAATAPSCPAGKPVAQFRLLVVPPKSGEALPLSEVNVIEPGDKLRYEPVPLAKKGDGDAKIGILLAAASGKDAGHIAVLDVKPAKAPAEWTVPVRASIVAVVFGPHGLDEGKINKLVKKNPELVLKLSDYVEQSSKVEALVQTLSKYQNAPAQSGNMQAALGQFSKQYGVSLPAVNSSTPSDQQAQQLLRALIPAFSGDPLAQTSVTQQSTGLAASVATFFMGPQFGIAAGGAALLGQLHAALFPRAEFRTALAEPKLPTGMNLCAGSTVPAKAHTRIAYLWALPVPNAAAPSASIAQNTRIPAAWNSSIELKSANQAQLRLLTRVRDWHLVAGATDVSIPAKVSIGPQSDLLALDLTHAKLPPGQYHLAAKWDWTPVSVGGTLEVVNFADYSSAKIANASRDHLISGARSVKVGMDGPDFEFLREVALLRASGSHALVSRLPFSFANEAGAQHSVVADVDASNLAPGAYLLQLTQLNGKTHEIPVTVHPPNPTLANLPLRVNTGETQQTLELHGTALDHIEKITSENATWTLAPEDPAAKDATARSATIRLNPNAKKGALISAKVYVTGIGEPLEFSDALRVAGPRPKILSARKSFAAEGGVELRDKEIPASSAVSFSIQGANFDYRSRLRLECQSADDTREAVELVPGQRKRTDELDSAGEGMLFLSVNAGEIGRSGCSLMATLADDSTGVSDPYFLGRVVRLPRIDKFTLTDEKMGDALYAAILTGQDLQEITKTGWDGKSGAPVVSIPTPVPGQPGEQTLKIAMPWPPPNPGAFLYIWLNGESDARPTTVKYQ